MSEYLGIFKAKYGAALKEAGRSWPKVIDPDDLNVLVQIGQAAHEYGAQGGRARAAKAQRDSRGRFVGKDGCNHPRERKQQQEIEQPGEQPKPAFLGRFRRGGSA